MLHFIPPCSTRAAPSQLRDNLPMGKDRLQAAESWPGRDGKWGGKQERIWEVQRASHELTLIQASLMLHVIQGWLAGIKKNKNTAVMGWSHLPKKIKSCSKKNTNLNPLALCVSQPSIEITFKKCRASLKNLRLLLLFASSPLPSPQPQPAEAQQTRARSLAASSPALPDAGGNL